MNTHLQEVKARYAALQKVRAEGRAAADQVMLDPGPTEGLCLGPYGGPRGNQFSGYEPVRQAHKSRLGS